MPSDFRNSTPLLCDLGTTFYVHDHISGQRMSAPIFWEVVAEKSNRLASAQLGKCAKILICEDRPIATLVSLFSCWAAGYCAVLVSPFLSDDEYARVEMYVKVAAALGRIEKGWDEDRGLSTGPLGRDDPALVMMTSGTIGEPKGVVLSLGSLQKRLRLNLHKISPEVLRSTLCVLPLSFGHGLIGNTLTALCADGDVHFWVRPRATELAGFSKKLEEWDITFLSSVPAFWQLVLRFSPPPERPLQRVHVGSAPLSKQLWQEIATWAGTDRVFNMYGMTETANWISGEVYSTSVKDGCVGEIWGGDFRVLVNGTLHESGRGEVLIGSPSPMLGYLRADGSIDDSNVIGWFPTGDVGELSKDGSLCLVGRLKNEINVGGFKVLCEEVDALLERNEEVAEACAFAVEDPVSGEIVGAAVSGPAKIDLDRLKNWCRSRARREAIPSLLFQLETLPRTERGKLDRKAVREVILQKSDPAQHV